MEYRSSTSPHLDKMMVHCESLVSKSSLGNKVGEGIIGRRSRMDKKSWKLKLAWCCQGGAARRGQAGEQEEPDDKGKKFALRCSLLLEGCLSKEIWKLCEGQTGTWCEVERSRWN